MDIKIPEKNIHYIIKVESLCLIKESPLKNEECEFIIPNCYIVNQPFTFCVNADGREEDYIIKNIAKYCTEEYLFYNGTIFRLNISRYDVPSGLYIDGYVIDYNPENDTYTKIFDMDMR